MSARKAFWKWSAITLIVAVFLVVTQAIALGGVAGLLQVSEMSDLRPLIESQLGEVPLASGLGHDGQIFYAMGLDLNGDEVGALLDHPSYRYRRILYPLFASVFGLLDGWALLYGMIALGVLSMAVSAGIVAAMAAQAGKTQYLSLAVVLNPGVWVSVRLLTSDALSLMLMLAALYAFTRRRATESASAFALSGLAKDVSLATPVPLGLRVRDWKMMMIPAGVVTAWTAVLHLRFGGGFASRGNLDWPFLGVVEATATWSASDVSEWVYLVFALVVVTAGLVFSLRSGWLRWPIVAWTALAIISSSWVWDYGNNAARAFAPILVLIALNGVYVSPGTELEASDTRPGS